MRPHYPTVWHFRGVVQFRPVAYDSRNHTSRRGGNGVGSLDNGATAERIGKGSGIAPMKVILETRLAPDGSDYWSLTVGRIYEVLGIAGDWYRLLDDCNEPIVFDPTCFRVIESAEPPCWVSSIEDDERYAYPPEWGRTGFFEDWHDSVPEVRETFWRGLAKWYPETAAERRTAPDVWPPSSTTRRHYQMLRLYRRRS